MWRECLLVGCLVLLFIEDYKVGVKDWNGIRVEKVVIRGWKFILEGRVGL